MTQVESAAVGTSGSLDRPDRPPVRLEMEIGRHPTIESALASNINRTNVGDFLKFVADQSADDAAVRRETIRWTAGIAILTVVLVFALCIAFLAYNKAELLEKMFGYLAAGGGGVGVGYIIPRRPIRSPRTRPGPVSPTSSR